MKNRDNIYRMPAPQAPVNAAAVYDRFFADTPVITTTLSGDIVWVNTAAERLLGYSISELRNSSILDFFLNDLSAESLTGRVSQSESIVIENGRIRRRDAGPVPCELIAWRTDDAPDGRIQIVIRMFKEAVRVAMAAA